MDAPNVLKKLTLTNIANQSELAEIESKIRVHYGG